MKISSDWHIHSEASCDSACMKITDLVQEAKIAGVTDFGVTDHVHTPFNLPDLDASRKAFLDASPSPRFHFGVEVSCVSQWELNQIAAGKVSYEPVYGIREGGPAGGALAIGATAEDLAARNVEYVVGGAHWPMYVPLERRAVIRDYHRQNMFLATHPLVNIVAHPWWWGEAHWADADGNYNGAPWFDSFKAVPNSMHNEFAGAVAANHKAVEINVHGMLLYPRYSERFKKEYLEYLAFLKERGCPLSIGSDCHRAHYPQGHYSDGRCFDVVEGMLDSVGIRESDLWSMPPRDQSEPETKKDLS